MSTPPPIMVIRLGDTLTRHLDGAASVERLLFDHHHTFSMGGSRSPMGRHPAISRRRHTRHGAPWQAGQGRVVPGGLVRALDERWTAIINGGDLNDPRINDVCLHLSRVYAAPHQHQRLYLLRTVQGVRGTLGQPRHDHRAGARVQELGAVRAVRALGRAALDWAGRLRQATVGRRHRTWDGSRDPPRLGPPGGRERGPVDPLHDRRQPARGPRHARSGALRGRLLADAAGRRALRRAGAGALVQRFGVR